VLDDVSIVVAEDDTLATSYGLTGQANDILKLIMSHANLVGALKVQRKLMGSVYGVSAILLVIMLGVDSVLRQTLPFRNVLPRSLIVVRGAGEFLVGFIVVLISFGLTQAIGVGNAVFCLMSTEIKYGNAALAYQVKRVRKGPRIVQSLVENGSTQLALGLLPNILTHQ